MSVADILEPHRDRPTLLMGPGCSRVSLDGVVEVRNRRPGPIASQWWQDRFSADEIRELGRHLDTLDNSDREYASWE